MSYESNSLYAFEGYWINGYVIGASEWTNVAANSNTWVDYNNNLYVDVNYVVDGYVVGSSVWSDAPLSSNTWFRKG